MTSTALVLLMIPGVGFFYSGLARRKSALSLIWLSMMSTAVVSFQVRSAPPIHAMRLSNVLGSGSSGAIHSHFPTRRAVFLETSITSAFVVFWDRNRSGAQRFQTSYLLFTRGCSHVSRMLGPLYTFVIPH